MAGKYLVLVLKDPLFILLTSITRADSVRKRPGLRPIPLPKLPPTSKPEEERPVDRQGDQAPANLPRSVTVELDTQSIEITPENLITINQLGRGAYGIVERVSHGPSGFHMALKRITLPMSQDEKIGLMDMYVLNKATSPNIVKFYGALFWEGDLWILMEVMDCSLDKFYKKIYPSSSDELEELNALDGNFDLLDLSAPIKFIPEQV